MNIQKDNPTLTVSEKSTKSSAYINKNKLIFAHSYGIHPFTIKLISISIIKSVYIQHYNICEVSRIYFYFPMTYKGRVFLPNHIETYQYCQPFFDVCVPFTLYSLNLKCFVGQHSEKETSFICIKYVWRIIVLNYALQLFDHSLVSLLSTSTDFNSPYTFIKLIPCRSLNLPNQPVKNVKSLSLSRVKIYSPHANSNGPETDRFWSRTRLNHSNTAFSVSLCLPFRNFFRFGLTLLCQHFKSRNQRMWSNREMSRYFWIWF